MKEREITYELFQDFVITKALINVTVKQVETKIFFSISICFYLRASAPGLKKVLLMVLITKLLTRVLLYQTALYYQSIPGMQSSQPNESKS